MFLSLLFTSKIKLRNSKANKMVKSSSIVSYKRDIKYKKVVTKSFWCNIFRFIYFFIISYSMIQNRHTHTHTYIETTTGWNSMRIIINETHSKQIIYLNGIAKAEEDNPAEKSFYSTNWFFLWIPSFVSCNLWCEDLF